MAAFFVLTAPIEESGVAGVYGMYTELRDLYTRALEIMEAKPDKREHLQIAQLVDGCIQPIVSVKKFVEVMKCLDEEVNEASLKVVVESKNIDFMVAFLREIISPECDPDAEQKEKYCKVLQICKEIMDAEELTLYRDVAEAGIRMYSSTNW